MMLCPIETHNTLRRFFKFNLVGGLGIVMQLAMLYLFTSLLRINYFLGTALAVEVAVLHNFIWHERFTWADRSRLATPVPLGRMGR